MEPSPSPPDSTVPDQVALSSPPAPVPEDDDLTRAVSLLSLAEAGKAGSAPRAVDPSPPSSAVSSHGHKDDDDDLAGVNKRTHARFLVTHAQAGLIIGMGGSTVAAVEARSGARVKLSRHDQLLPGTDRRVVLVHGLLSQFMDAMELLLQRLLLYQVQGDQVSDSEATLVLVVPQPCCSVLIGKGGSVIKSFTEALETAIQISPQNISYGFNDRLVTITGPLDNLLRAVFLIIFELLEDIRYLFPCAAATPNIPMRSPVNKDAQESVTIAVADEHMGAVIGRGRRIINEISKPNTPTNEITCLSTRKDAQEESVTIAVADEHMGAVIGRGGRIINEISKVSGEHLRQGGVHARDSQQGGDYEGHIRGDPRSRGDDHPPRLRGQRQLDGAEVGGNKRWQGSAYHQAGRGGG